MAGTLKEITIAEGVVVAAAVDTGLKATGLEVYTSDAAYELNVGTPEDGSMYFNSTDNVIRIYSDSAWMDANSNLMLDPLTVLVADASSEIVSSTITITELESLSGISSNIQDQLDAKLDDITYTASRALISDGSGDIAVSTVTSTELGYISGLTSSVQTQLNSKLDDITYTASRALISNGSGDIAVSAVTSTELGYISGLTSSVQTQLNSKLDDITYTASRALVSDGSGDIAVSAVTSTELGYISGLTSSAQTQINNKISSSSTDTLTNKTINGSSNTISNISLTSSVTGTLPVSNGGTGQSSYTTGDMVYASSSSALSKLGIGTQSQVLSVSSGGIPEWTTISSSSGINYISNYKADNSTTGYSLYNDSASLPVDGTGGSASITFTVTTSSPLRGSNSFLITKGATNRQGDGVAYDFTIDSADKNKVLTISADYEISGTYSTGDLIIYIYDVTNATMIQPFGYSLESATISFKKICTFQTTSSTSYRLLFHVSSTSASSYTVKFDNLIVGPQSQQYGAPVVDWESFTPTGSWSTNTTYTGRMRRVGDSLDLDIQITLDGAPTAANLTINMPTGYTVDVNKLAAPTNQLQRIGLATIRDSGTDTYSGYAILESGYTSFSIFKDDGDGTVSAVSSTTPFTFASSDYIQIKISALPISGLSSGMVISTSTRAGEIATRVVKTSNQTISTTAATKITFNSTSSTVGGYDTIGAWDSTNNKYVVAFPGKYDVIMNIAAANFDASASAQLYIYKNGSVYIRYDVISSSVASTRTIPFTSGLDLVAGDYLEFYMSSGDSSYNVIGFNGVGDTQSVVEIKRRSDSVLIGQREKLIACYRSSSGQSIPNNSMTIIDFATKEDNGDSHSAVTTGASFKFTAPFADWFKVNSHIDLNSVTNFTTGEYFSIHLYKNGSVYSRHYIPFSGSPGALDGGIYLSKAVYLLTNEYIDIRVYQNSGGSVSLNGSVLDNWIEIWN